MSRTRTSITQENAKKIYQYFAKALQEKRIFADDLKKLAEAKQAFYELASTYDETIESSDLQSLQSWVNTYVPFDKWKRCLATLRQIRANKRHDVRSLKLNCETYDLLKDYAHYCQINMQTAIYNTIKPLCDQVVQNTRSTAAIFQQALSVQTKCSSDNNGSSAKKTIQLGLRLAVENNSQFARGKKKSLEDIEFFCLRHYDAKKVKGESYQYVIAVVYETEEELDESIKDIYCEMSSHADLQDCFIEAGIFTLDEERYWSMW